MTWVIMPRLCCFSMIPKNTQWFLQESWKNHMNFLVIQGPLWSMRWSGSGSSRFIALTSGKTTQELQPGHAKDWRLKKNPIRVYRTVFSSFVHYALTEFSSHILSWTKQVLLVPLAKDYETIWRFPVARTAEIGLLLYGLRIEKKQFVVFQ